MIRRMHYRQGVTAVECALVYPVFFLLLIGMIVMGLGVFRYQEVAAMAREGARYAAVHGYQYQQSTGNLAATAEDIYENAIKPKATAMDLSRLSYSVTWNPDNRQDATVTVTVNYFWVPEVFFGGISLSSTSTMPISF